jgi:hypothetical protein
MVEFKLDRLSDLDGVKVGMSRIQQIVELQGDDDARDPQSDVRFLSQPFVSDAAGN